MPLTHRTRGNAVSRRSAIIQHAMRSSLGRVDISACGLSADGLYRPPRDGRFIPVSMASSLR